MATLTVYVDDVSTNTYIVLLIRFLQEQRLCSCSTRLTLALLRQLLLSKIIKKLLKTGFKKSFHLHRVDLFTASRKFKIKDTRTIKFKLTLKVEQHST